MCYSVGVPVGHQPRAQRAIARRLRVQVVWKCSDYNTLKAAAEIDLDDAVIVALGSNLPGRYDSVESLLEAALTSLQGAGLKVVARSSWWRSLAWPDPAEPPYLNGVAIVDIAEGPRWTRGARWTLNALHVIEQAFDRYRGSPNSARTLDLDLVAYGRVVLGEPGLHLPHPRAHERRFVMGPLAQIAPGWRHPQLGQTAENLAASAKIGMDAAPVG